MHLYSVLFKKHPWKIFQFSLLGLITGVVNALLFMYINQIIMKILTNESIEFNWYIFSYLFIIWMFVFSKRILAISIIHFTQNNLYDFKSELISLVLRSDYADVNKRKGMIFNVLTRDIEQISEAGNVLTNLISSIILAIGCLVYIAVISWKLFFITMVIIVGGVLSYRLSMKRITTVFNVVKDLNDEFISYLNQVINGFKEIKTDKEKGRDLETNHIKPNLNRYHAIVVRTFSGFMNAQNIGMILFYLAIGFMLIVGGNLFQIKKEELVTFVFVLLFINGPIQSIILLLPIIAEANVSSRRLTELKRELELTAPADESSPTETSSLIKDFETLHLKEICFQYKNDERQFGIGPITLDIKKSEIIFIHGGNGSGKTSFIMCLLGIYTCDSGEILVNGKKADENYTSLFSTVFSDFFLFDKFYGNSQFDREKASYYLNLFELESKVTFTEEGFSTIKLSMGQRKRLALIQALLENKPLIIIDEWAADQDPYFREKFYTKILPLIKAEGRTVIAITHDDKYFGASDRLFKMEYGKLL